MRDETGTGPTGRRRGGLPRIDRAQIVDVAKRLDPSTMTMQAVADQLGVDRKAINYHVTDRDGLRRLVAADAFESRFDAVFGSCLDTEDAVVPGHWHNAVRAWAEAVRDGMVAAGIVTNFFRIDADSPAVFEPVELVLQRMLAAGFDIATASRGLIFLTRAAMGVGRDLVLEQQSGEHPQNTEVKRVMPTDGDGLEAFRWLIAADLNSPDDIENQFDFEIRTFISGMEHQRDAARADGA